MTQYKFNKISVVINTYNEESNIQRCIESIKCIADEIVVCDMHSEDKTVEIAKKFGAVIVYYENTGYVEPGRYYAISNASYEWVLVIDADEMMTERLAVKLREIVQEDKVDVVFIGILFNYFGKIIRHGGFFNNNFPRFFRKKVYQETYDKRDEFIHCAFTNLREKVKNRIKLPLNYYIEHYAYDSIKGYVNKSIGKYAFIEAENMFYRGEKFKLSKLIFHPLRIFITTYMIRAGFLDGIEGLILSTLYMAFRFAIWADLWFLESNYQRRNKR